MQSAELRERFLSFFAARDHTIVESDPLIPSGDPTVLFTSAGMNQFKDYFVGTRTDLRRAASCQKCLRTGDLEKVGETASHHSFFEMLGNFSFGDYFKHEAIQWAWEFLTGTVDYAGTPSPDQKRLCLTLPAKRLWVSVYEEDDDAFQLWRQLGMPAERIKRFGQTENFWPANTPTQGPNGPCGPCSEIYYDPKGEVRPKESVEVWNLVFTQYDRQPDGSLTPLSKPSIDTGMGLERLAAVVQGTASDYETDLFTPIMTAVRELSHGKKIKTSPVEFAERAIADHIRAIVFLIADEVLPSNESRGYVLRMLIRRAIRLAQQLGGLEGKWTTADQRPAFLGLLVDCVRGSMVGSPYYDTLVAKRDIITRVVDQEEAQFLQTLATGTSHLDELFEKLKKSNVRIVPGEEAFKLHDTYGFPLELTIDAAHERGMEVDRDGFQAALTVQQARSRAASQFGGGVFVTDAMRVREALSRVPPREEQFIGYETLQAEARIAGLWDGHRWVDQIAAPQPVGIVLDRSPFYGESGGQIGDTGRLEGARGMAVVQQTAWVDDVLVHQAIVPQGTLKVQEAVRATVDAARRLKIARSHTATHLLHWALRKILGPETVQAGSLVDADRLRFDFSSLQGLHEEQRHQVEALINQRVRMSDEVRTTQMPLAEAKRAGALAFFGEKYGATARVVTIGDYSKELCGGTHLFHTGFVGTFAIVGEGSIAAGTRRIEAVVGEAAAERQQEQARLLHDLGRRLGRPAQELLAGLEELLEQLKRSERERKALRLEVAKVEARRLVAEGKRIDGTLFIAATLHNTDRDTLAMMADAVKASLDEEGIVVLASGGAGRVAVVIAMTPQVAGRLPAGQLLKAIAPVIQGSGGGRPEFAQGGGKDPSRIPAALKRAEELVREALTHT